MDLATLGADALPSGQGGLFASGGGGSTPSLRQGQTVVTGRLPPEVIQRIARQNFGRFRLCYESGLRKNPTLAGRVTTKLEIDGTGAVTSATDAGSTVPDKDVVDCVVRAFKTLTFPEPEGKSKVTVVYPIELAPGGGGGGGSPSFGGRLGGSLGSFVLTRLHARYAKDALGSDLVFKEAPAIVGGRESRGEKGALETGAMPASTNSFQARYAIRHEWKGAIACKEPRRGMWGGPWPDAGVAESGPVAAQKLAYAPRGNLTLAAFVPNGVPELALAAGGASQGPTPGPSTGAMPSDAPEAGADAGTPPPPTPASRCGCRVVGTSSGGPLSLVLAALVLGAVAARRRGRARA
jgi:MYXO-CTERM domain-containing protein